MAEAKEKSVTEQTMLWVGIGASAGGLEALQELAKNLPEQANAAYIVAQHLSPKHQSMLTQLIQRSTKLSVEEAKNGLIPQPNCIYVTPPNKDIFVEDGRIHLATPQDEHTPKPSADTLLISLAEQVGSHAIAVILSGTGSDGARGVREIRAAGGISIAQDADSAKYDGMPNAAIDTGCIDMVLDPAEIARHINKVASKFPLDRDLIDEDKTAHSDGFGELLELIHKRTKVNLKDYKKATLKRRLERRMLARGINKFEDYLAYAKENKEELDLLFQDILISVTEFYRDPTAFEALKKIIKTIVDGKQGQEPLRVWIVGCATGEEVYTVAILFAEAIGGPQRLLETNLQFFATDIDETALKKARQGVYPASSLQSLPSSLRSRYFRVHKESAEVIKDIRDLVLFSKHNIIADPPFMRMDLICCRNLLIYFENELQQRIYHIFHYALQPNGYLFLGKSESASQTSQLFSTVDLKAKTFQRRPGGADTGAHGMILLQHRRHNINTKIDIPRKHSSNAKSSPALFEGLVNNLADGAVLVNEVLDIEWLYGNVNQYIQVRSGHPELNLGDLVSDVHRDEIRALVYKSARENQVVQGQPKNNRLADGLFKTQLTVYPLQVGRTSQQRLLVTFQKQSREETTEAGTEAETKTSYVRELEEELSAAREHLQTVIEELETSNEELQSLNEELQSANEELQSTNEELETSNEELQSTNEELVTVNDELTAKTSELERLSHKLSQIKNSLDFPLIVVNGDYQVIAHNAKAKKRFKIGRNKAHLVSILPNFCEPEKVQKLTRKVIESGKTRTVHLDSDTRSYWLRILPFRLEEKGEIIGAVHTYIDYTAQRKAEQDLARAKDVAEKANDAKSEFLANISHDIRTPMNAIVGVTNILTSMEMPPEKQKELLHTMATSSEELNHLIEELLDFAKLESGSMTLDKQDFNLKDLLHKVVEMTSVIAEQKKLRFKFHIGENLPEHLRGDPLKLRQILMNILGNAVKFTSEGYVELTVFCKEPILDECNICFTISDTGIGVAEDKLESIFEKFSQADSSTQTKFGGSGLGLSISKALASLMGGSIEASSKPGEGTVFMVNLPLPLAANEQASDSIPENVEPLFADSKEAAAAPVLIVEDIESNITVLSAYLDHLRCDYEIARNGVEAIEAVKEKQFAVILMDLFMPQMDGFETTRRIREHSDENDEDMPAVIAVTGHVQERVEARAKAAGMKIFLHKPLDIRDLREALATTLAESQTQIA